MDAMRRICLGSGRIAPRPFAIAILAVYLLAFLSQILLAAPVTARAGIWPFVAAQAALIWIWFALHADRLRDAGRAVAPAIGIACLCALAVILLMLVIAVNPPGDRPGHPFAVVDLLGQIFGDPELTGFGLILLVFLAMILVPVLVAVGFSIATGRRASVPD